MANISYDKIQTYTQIERSRIKAATSFLASLSLVYVEYIADTSKTYGSNGYRIVGVDPYVHMGTSGGRTNELQF